jgi:lysozyme family protein
MKKIRKNIFETNSSSTHSVVIKEGEFKNFPKNINSLNITTDDYGWEKHTYTDFTDKASYALTYAINYGTKKDLKMLDKILKEQLNIKDIKYDGLTLKQALNYVGNDSEKFGYIDHQSIEEASKIFKDENNLKSFLFSKDSYFKTDNDNM